MLAAQTAITDQLPVASIIEGKPESSVTSSTIPTPTSPVPAASSSNNCTFSCNHNAICFFIVVTVIVSASSKPFVGASVPAPSTLKRKSEDVSGGMQPKKKKFFLVVLKHFQ